MCINNSFNLYCFQINRLIHIYQQGYEEKYLDKIDQLSKEYFSQIENRKDKDSLYFLNKRLKSFVLGKDLQLLKLFKNMIHTIHLKNNEKDLEMTAQTNVHWDNLPFEIKLQIVSLLNLDSMNLMLINKEWKQLSQPFIIENFSYLLSPKNLINYIQQSQCGQNIKSLTLKNPIPNDLERVLKLCPHLKKIKIEGKIELLPFIQQSKYLKNLDLSDDFDSFLIKELKNRFPFLTINIIENKEEPKESYAMED